MKETVLLYFGSFNPVHVGHLIIAQEALYRSGAQKLWFVISPRNPLKSQDELAPEEHRKKMLEMALAGCDLRKYVSVCDIEFAMPRPSYTVDTLDELRRLHPGTSFGMLIGEDNLRFFGRWKSHDRILDSTRIFVYARNGCNMKEIPAEIAMHPNLTVWSDSPLLDVSSSQIRDKIVNDRPFGAYLPCGVAEYIEKYGLYRNHESNR